MLHFMKIREDTEITIIISLGYMSRILIFNRHLFLPPSQVRFFSQLFDECRIYDQ